MFGLEVKVKMPSTHQWTMITNREEDEAAADSQYVQYQQTILGAQATGYNACEHTDGR